ncbi:MAG: hypothetical protein WBB30_08345, partial [Solirubrobacterales bacterium]
AMAGVALIAIGVLGPRLRINIGLRWEPEGADISLNLGVDARPDRLPAGDTNVTLAEGAAPEETPAIESNAETVEFSAEAVREALAKADNEQPDVRHLLPVAEPSSVASLPASGRDI